MSYLESDNMGTKVINIGELLAETTSLREQLAIAVWALNFYANADHHKRVLPWHEKDGWQKELRDKGFWHYATDRDDEEEWFETGQCAEQALAQIRELEK